MNDEFLRQSKKWFLHTALSYIGTPYIWGGDDPSGFDCSGLVVELLKTIGLLKEADDYTADGLWRFLEQTKSDKFTIKELFRPCEGALLFYLNQSGRLVHITICLDEYFQIGASGGDSSVITSDDARLKNAYIKIRPINFNANKMKLISLF